MASAPCNSETVIVYASWKGTQFNQVVGVSYTVTIGENVIPGEGVLGPSCRAPIASDLVATVTFLVPPPFDPIANIRTVGDLVFQIIQGDGGTRTCTMDDMIPRGFTYDYSRMAGSLATYVQQFAHQGDMATLPITNP
jgi:hypothetical protein